jgi:hypothetical protein
MKTEVTADGWSAYDASVPHPTHLPDVVERSAALRRRRAAPAEVSLADVRQVVLVVSSSRGGSTLFGQVLRRVPGLLHLRAEVNPLFTLAGLHHGEDRRRILEAELLRDLGTPLPPGRVTAQERARLVLDLAWRLTMQWPGLATSMSLNELMGRVEEVVPAAGGEYRPTPVHRSLMAALRRTGAEVHAGCYDLDPSAADDPPDSPVGPPGEVVVEMPPFVAIDRWRLASATQVRSLPLVISTPRCSFRLGFFRDLFPAADLRVIHLTRNPAAAVNGLVDGWRHHGFFNCQVPGELAIKGYSDVVPGGTKWWCYDFPPGWEEWTSAPLEEVCAFQWRATHAAVIDGSQRLGIEPLRVRFEDVVGSTSARTDVAARLASVLGVNRGAVGAALLAEHPVVMATTPPSPARWRRRRDGLARLVSDPRVAPLARRLSYDPDPSGWV